MRRPTDNAFSMIEVAVAIAIIAILAGSVAPLAIKALNQQREQKTRENLKIAFEAMFGARDRRVANMRADWGFNPGAGLANLGKMTTRTAAPAPNPPASFALNGASFRWGWNGPYWTGTTMLVAGVPVPVDGWGRPIQLRLVTGGNAGFQVISLGANGQMDSVIGNRVPLGDDIVYPEMPVDLASGYTSNLSVHLVNNRPSSNSIDYFIEVRWCNGNALSNPATLDNGRFPNGTGTLTLTPSSSADFNPGSTPPLPKFPSGPVQVHIHVNPAASPYTAAVDTTEVLDLLPGESKNLTYSIN
jgi:prepilin-type N-terminal cleavage/methylation domain-containing protein